jgi:hypothetical protein
MGAPLRIVVAPDSFGGASTRLPWRTPSPPAGCGHGLAMRSAWRRWPMAARGRWRPSQHWATLRCGALGCGARRPRPADLGRLPPPRRRRTAFIEMAAASGCQAPSPTAPRHCAPGEHPPGAGAQRTRRRREPRDPGRMRRPTDGGSGCWPPGRRFLDLAEQSCAWGRSLAGRSSSTRRA